MKLLNKKPISIGLTLGLFISIIGTSLINADELPNAQCTQLPNDSNPYYYFLDTCVGPSNASSCGTPSCEAWNVPGEDDWYCRPCDSGQSCDSCYYFPVPADLYTGTCHFDNGTVPEGECYCRYPQNAKPTHEDFKDCSS